MVLSLTTENAFLAWIYIYICIFLFHPNQWEEAAQTACKSPCLSCTLNRVIETSGWWGRRHLCPENRLYKLEVILWWGTPQRCSLGDSSGTANVSPKMLMIWENTVNMCDKLKRIDMHPDRKISFDYQEIKEIKMAPIRDVSWGTSGKAPWSRQRASLQGRGGGVYSITSGLMNTPNPLPFEHQGAKPLRIPMYSSALYSPVPWQC